MFPDPFVTDFSHLRETSLPHSRVEFSHGRGMTLRSQFWSQSNTFACNEGKKENSLKTAWIETSEVLCFGLLPLLFKLGTSSIVLDFNRIRRMSKSSKKNPTHYFQCMVLSSRKILVLEGIMGFCNTQRWTPCFLLHVRSTPSGCPWVFLAP